MWLELGAIGASIRLGEQMQTPQIAYFGLSIVGLVYYLRTRLTDDGLLLVDRPLGASKNLLSGPCRDEHDRRRHETYPRSFVPNTWYHLCDSEELKAGGAVKEIRALGQTLVLWRASDGSPVCQDAFCLHIGANLAVGGKVINDCIQCPFHKWSFAKDGSVSEIPYIKNPKQCPTTQKLKTYKCVDWCGLVCIYFHADKSTEEEPEFHLNTWLPQQLKKEHFVPHMKWNVGFYRVTVTDWVDQAGDHSHFHMLHDKFLIPYTLLSFPDWLLRLFPVGIAHELVTYRGDDPDWVAKMGELGMGETDKHNIYFTDRAGLTWGGKLLETTVSETLENYMGPAMVAFHLPFTIGTIKLLFTVTPVEGGCIHRTRTFIDYGTHINPFKRLIAWILVGISASQLAADISILTNKIRMKKPILQPFDGPFNRVNNWLKMFCSEGTDKVGTECYVNEW